MPDSLKFEDFSPEMTGDADEHAPPGGARRVLAAHQTLDLQEQTPGGPVAQLPRPQLHLEQRLLTGCYSVQIAPFHFWQRILLHTNAAIVILVAENEKK